MKSGIVIINKESGDTSQRVVSKVKKKLNIKKAGHIGTLDPLATGVLPILIGDATKLSKYLIEHDKTYIAIIKLGIKKDTGDNEGETIETCDVDDLNQDKIINVLKSFVGKQEQAPHKFSAVKINGKKLYEYARQGEEVEIPKRKIEIYSCEFIELDNKEKTIKFKVSCSKGTYIRVLCEDIAEKLGTIGYMDYLQRVKVDKFDISNSVEIENLNENDIISVEEICKEYEKIELNVRKLELFLNGVKLTWHKDSGVYKIYHNSEFIGLGTIENELLKRDVIIKSSSDK